MNIQVMVTQRCNAVCDYCNRAVGLANFKDMDLTAAQMEVIVQQSLDAELDIGRVVLTGGEPVVNVELQGIIDACAGFKANGIRVLTNDTPAGKPLRDKIVFPDERFGWRRSPLDDPNDAYSGKSIKGILAKVRRRGVHTPYWISPDDIGMKATFKQCSLRGYCGVGVDASGWVMCSQAGTLGRVLGIDPYTTDGDIKKHINTPIEDMCKHCQYGLGKRGSNKIGARVAKGEIPYTMSPTFVDALKRFENEPVTFPIQFATEGVDEQQALARAD